MAICKGCGQEFEPDLKRRLYCSAECRDSSTKARRHAVVVEAHQDMGRKPVEHVLAENDREVRECSICHEPFERGYRVNMSFLWEYPCKVDTWDGKVDGYRTKGRSAKVCRRCAEEIAGKAMLEVPEEVGR